MKKYYAEVKLKSWAISFVANNKKDFIEEVKNHFWEEYDIDLDSEGEITNIKHILESKEPSRKG